jgi:hypothetical protein
MNTTADKAVTGAIATVKNNSSKIKSVKIKVKFGGKDDSEDKSKKKGLAGYASQMRMGASAMSKTGPDGK